MEQFFEMILNVSKEALKKEKKTDDEIKKMMGMTLYNNDCYSLNNLLIFACKNGLDMVKFVIRRMGGGYKIPCIFYII